MASSRASPSPLAGLTWHASIPKAVESVAPASKGFSPLTCSPGSMVPGGDCSWSGGWKQLFTTNSNSSDWPSQSAASSASWSDELENESTKRLSEQYQELESALYGDTSGDALSNPNLALECKQWKERFPHLRAVGVSVKMAPAVDCPTYESEDAHLDENGEEEIIASHGSYENIVEENAIVPRNDVQTPTVLVVDDVTEEDITVYREKVKKEVLSQLFSRIWPNVVKKIDPVFKKILERNKLSAHTTTKILIEDNSCNMLQPSNGSDVGFSSTETFLRISPISTSQLSPKKSIVGTPSPVSQGSKSSARDCSAPSQITSLNVRNTSPVVLKNTPTITLAPPAVVVFPSPEKTLNPLPSDARNMTQSARSIKKLSTKTSQSAKNRLLQVKEPSQEEGRFVTQDKSRVSAQTNNMRKSARGYWNRHGMLPPISLKENIKAGSAASQRSSSALMKFGKPDLDTRPNTSLPSKSTITLLPLNEGNKKKNRMELAQEWLDKQLSTSNNSKHHLSVYVDTSSRWRSHNFGYRK